MSTKEEQLGLVLRFRKAFMNGNRTATVSGKQAASTQDKEARGSIWVSRVSVPAPSATNVRQHLLEAIANLGTGKESFVLPHYGPIEGEWVGARAGIRDRNAPEPAIPEAEKYEHLVRDCRNDTTILYAHGGAFFYGGPATARSTTAPLAQLTRGRCFALRYRLGPQHAAPSQQLDFLMAYLALLYPPPGALHAPVPASCIVFAGDSCGASIAFATVQIILQLRRQQRTERPTVVFAGRTVEVPFPAGVTSLSCASDMTMCLPSMRDAAYATRDFILDPPPYRVNDLPVEEGIWPTSPSRAEMAVDLSAMMHPLFNSSFDADWAGAPPMWICCGEERLADASRLLAQTATAQGVSVQYVEYEMMPHIFVAMRRLPQTEHCLRAWAEAAMSFTKGEAPPSGASLVRAGELREEVRDVRRLVGFTREQAVEMMGAKMKTIVAYEGPGKHKPLSSL